ncbi:aminoglycoside phosphotransferase family protein [Streptomyces mangrovisoli]|uniref:Phosphotransferase n=1 Tax=Streptomyces mangrovisoli TaxID=1428628 RepID=A0A1J4NLZ2_9ACTN|nr:aminoglycoside phosphotransferase family protein [Streptomyces mangrovisoli]OIJ62644.1 phosphotransferase [Streptomyces mangrovisoli]
MRTGTPQPDTALVRRLVADRFPRWAGLSVAPVPSAGTSNAMYRLGPDMVVRLPRTDGSAADVAKEHRWLPLLAPRLPVAVPVPLGRGEPTDAFPRPWSVYRWLDGAPPDVDSLTEPQASALARDLAECVGALHGTDPAGGPASYRSEPLAQRDGATRAAIAELRAEVDGGAAAALWESALRAPAHAGPPVWIHADLQPGNLLLRAGRLAAVIDFGCLGLGDPAVDLIAAWYVLPPRARETFRTVTGADPGAWERGRGWALSVALMELQAYRGSHPVMAGHARRVIGALLGSPALLEHPRDLGDPHLVAPVVGAPPDAPDA